MVKWSNMWSSGAPGEQRRRGVATLTRYQQDSSKTDNERQPKNVLSYKQSTHRSTDAHTPRQCDCSEPSQKHHLKQNKTKPCQKHRKTVFKRGLHLHGWAAGHSRGWRNTSGNCGRQQWQQWWEPGDTLGGLIDLVEKVFSNSPNIMFALGQVQILFIRLGKFHFISSFRGPSIEYGC